MILQVTLTRTLSHTQGVPECGMIKTLFGGSVVHWPSATSYQPFCSTGLTGGDPFVEIFGKYKEMRKQFVGEGRRAAARAKR